MYKRQVANNANDTLESLPLLILILSLNIQIGGYKDVPDSEVTPRRACPNGIVRLQNLYGKY